MDRAYARRPQWISARFTMAFFLFVIGWSWSFWIAAAVLEVSVRTAQGHALLLLGLCGPMVGGIGFAWFTRSDRTWSDYWIRAVDPRRIGGCWWAVILLLVPALVALAALLAVVSGDSAVPSLLCSNGARLLAAPSAVATFLLGLLLLGPLPEELGWRGYALGHMQRRYGALSSALILGMVWAVWHTPLFFLKDMLHWQHGFGSTWFWLFMAQVPCMSVAMTWLFNQTRSSTLAAILFHFVTNLAYSLGNVTGATNAWAAIIWAGAAAAIGWRLVARPPTAKAL